MEVKTPPPQQQLAQHKALLKISSSPPPFDVGRTVEVLASSTAIPLPDREFPPFPFLYKTSPITRGLRRQWPHLPMEALVGPLYILATGMKEEEVTSRR